MATKISREAEQKASQDLAASLRLEAYQDERIAQERRRAAERKRRQADRIEGKSQAYAAQSDEAILARRNSWGSYLRRVSQYVRDTGKRMKYPTVYKNAIKLFRYIYRSYKARDFQEPVRIPFVKMKHHLDLSEKYVYELLALLQGKSIPKRGRKLEGLYNEDGSPLITVTDGGQRSNLYVLNKPLITSVED